MALYDARQSVYVSGDTILAAHSNDELDRILAAFDKTTGHLHDGSTTGDGPKLVVLGAVNSGSITSGFGTIDIGSSTFGTTGTITGPSGTWDSGGMDIATGDTYAIASTNVLTATVLGTAVVTSSLTTVGALNSGSITSGFGSINTGSSSISTTGTLTTGTANLDGTVNINGSAAAVDFTVKGDNNTQLIFLDGSQDAISLGGANIDGAALIINNLTDRTAATSVGQQVHIPAQTQNFDNASSTIAIGTANFIGIPTMTGSNATLTMTNAATLYIQGAPVAGSNVAHTTAGYSLWVDAGGVRFDGTSTLSGTVTGPSGTWDSGGMDIAASDTYAIDGTNVLNATTLGGAVVNSSLTSVGTITTGVWGGTDITVANGGTGVSTLTDGGILLGSGTDAITAMAVLANSEMIVGNGSTDPVAESGPTLRNSVGVGTTSDVDFGSFAMKGHKHQSVSFGIKNDGGNMTHRIGGYGGSGDGGNFIDKFLNSSRTFGDTPTIDSSTAMTTGAGIVAAATSMFTFDTAAQTRLDMGGNYHFFYNDTGSTFNLTLLTRSENIDGVTVDRFMVQFTHPTTGAAHGINTTNWPTGDSTDIAMELRVA
jgi:hypothetical protein